MLGSGAELSDHRALLFDPMKPSLGSWRAVDLGLRPRRTTPDGETCEDFNGGGIRFGTETKMVDDDESDVFSPPLWKTSPSTSPKGGNSPLHPVYHDHHHFRNPSNTSRVQAIVRGRIELMELVRNMPESSYELSLKDLVEQPMMEVRQDKQSSTKHTTLKDEIAKTGETERKRDGKKCKSDKKGQMKRSGSIDNGGFLLKMVFPIKLGSKKKKKSAVNACAKVSPKPLSSDGSVKGIDKEWWKKRSCGSEDCESTGSSGSRGSSNSSSSSRHVSGFLPSCWSFFCRNKRTKTVQ